MKIIVLVTLTLVAANFDTTVKKEDNFASAISLMIQDFYVKQSNTISISEYSTNRLGFIHSIIIGNILAELDKSSLFVSVAWTIKDDPYLNQSIDFINNIIFIDTYGSWRLISENIVPQSSDFSGFYTVVITTLYKDHTTIVTNILRDCWKNGMLDVNVLTYDPTKTGDLMLYTYFPFTPSHCGKVVPVIWNHFRNGRFVDSNRRLFPVKTQNFYQCPITVLVCPLKPFISVKKTYANGTYDFEGTEYNLLQTLSERINFKPVFSIHWDEDLGLLYEDVDFYRKMNITIGAMIYTPADKEILSATKSYSFENVVFVVPNARPYTSFEKLFMPFTLSTWTLILVVVMSAIVLIKILQLNDRAVYEFVVGENNVSPYLNLIHLMIISGGVYEPRNNFARFLLIIWILACFILQTVYQGQLFTFIKMNKVKRSVQSIDELIERNITIKLIEENYHEFLTFDEQLEKLLKFVNSTSNYEYVTENEAYVTLEKQLVDQTRRKSYANESFGKPETIKIGTYPQVIILNKNSYLKAILDDQIVSMNENGLSDEWDSHFKLSSIYDTANGPRKLYLSELIGVMEMCFCLLMVATAIFILEILSPYWPDVKAVLLCRVYINADV